MSGQPAAEAGVEALVDRLHRDGVEAGREEARRLIETARVEAETLLLAAKAERSRLLMDAERQSEALRRSSEAALELAKRDTLLHMREALTVLLVDRLGARVRETLADRTLLAELIGWAARAMTGDGRMSVELEGADGVGGQLAELADALFLDLAEQQPVLRLDGVRPGVVLRREGGALAIELTDETLTAFLFAQLQPRFRKVFEGARLD